VASAEQTAGTTVRRLTTDRASSAPDWGPGSASANTAPTITSLRPTIDSTVTDRTPLIGAKVTDVETNLAKSNITLFLDGIGIARAEFFYNRETDRLRYTPETALSLGKHTVRVVARDPEGLVKRRVWSFRIARQ
jgi:hypothetical protein